MAYSSSEDGDGTGKKETVAVTARKGEEEKKGFIGRVMGSCSKQSVTNPNVTFKRPAGLLY